HVASETLGHTAPAGRYVRIDVIDRGAGIADDIKDRVMDPYFSTRSGSTGLGLSTAFAIATRHDGWLDFETRSGHGSTFRVYLPAHVAAPESVSHQSPAPSGRPARILVMDDEPAIRQMYEDALTGQGFRVVSTDDGRAAVDAFSTARRQDDPFDLVIMDLTVPGGTGGREAMASIRATDPSVRGIVASGYSSDPVMARYEDYGFAAAVHKPFSLDTLAEAVHSLLGEAVDHGHA
ncbi:MAG: response regulator, partial [Pseudomonadota bacterium]